ncbi:hypothetical protein BGZ61DRAFT_441933 [Ilyonectria robusta]|uniref:uncharacterized protein n=1 Tax=Ilyonectria robusta TaxID=1079257 RepID=UPI001E8D553C|nr:uncharacterized protein BGZ61DRAFT_441933 [Ilyonectria robusta]KAH8736397.1 hypothetical protein BGZ61DRAFT_441933 [Ilyonectria robusta]
MSRPSYDSGTGDENCSLAILRKLSALRPRPSPNSYPSIASIPQTSTARLAQAAEDPAHDRDHPTPDTYLYLAYGSNLAAETFLGMRGIRPLSQTNVSVPTLELKFNLPGIPYREPCFANVDFRKIPDHPKLPDPSNPPRIPPIDPPAIQPPPHTLTSWNEGLIGVVYEVTAEDYGTIIRTEGGGAGYKEIVVPCIPIPPKISVPEKPPIPELPKPFLARTLFAPQIPEPNQPEDPRKKKWWYRFLVGPHREPNYAQASARYLKLITDGAEEHELPDGYQRWLKSLQPYTTTTWKQQLGALLFTLTSGLMFLLMVGISKLVADKDGKLPHWMVIAMTVMINLTWMEYDAIFKPIFGDGERTQDDEDKKKRNCERWAKMFRHQSQPVDEEKVALLEEFE